MQNCFKLLALLLLVFLPEAHLSAVPRDYIEMQLIERQLRAEEQLADIKRLDAQIEHNLDRLEARFLSVKDSQESRITVQQTKEKLIGSLGELAQYYQEQRDLFLKEARSNDPRSDKEVLDRIAKAYDEHINKRIAQITRLSQSLASPNPNSNRGSDKQIARRTREQRNAVVETLQGIIQRLENENKELRLRIKSLSVDDAKLMQSAIDQNDELIATRQQQLELMEDAPQIAAKPVSKSEALELRKLLEASAQDIKEDSYRLSNLAIAYAKQIEAIRRLKAQLNSPEES